MTEEQNEGQDVAGGEHTAVTEMHTVTIRRIGNSLGAILPAKALELAGMKEGARVTLVASDDGSLTLVRESPPGAGRGGRSAAFRRQVGRQAAMDYMDTHEASLRALKDK